MASFGWSLAYDNQTKVLAVGSPSRNVGLGIHCGSVFLYSLAGNLSELTYKSHVGTIVSEEYQSRFGK